MIAGDAVTLKHEGQAIKAMVVLASPNKESLFLLFEGQFAGNVQAIALLWDRIKQTYVDLFFEREIEVEEHGCLFKPS